MLHIYIYTIGTPGKLSLGRSIHFLFVSFPESFEFTMVRLWSPTIASLEVLLAVGPLEVLWDAWKHEGIFIYPQFVDCRLWNVVDGTCSCFYGVFIIVQQQLIASKSLSPEWIYPYYTYYKQIASNISNGFFMIQLQVPSPTSATGATSEILAGSD